MISIQLSKNWFLLIPIIMVVGCVAVEGPSKKAAPFGLITTPASYYSTPKARYLGGKYRENLDRLVDRIVRSPKTANLQFANNIASVGGIGFFTHSAARTPDERYLEVVLGAPETFETKGDYSAKVQRLFALYGTELLSILAGDSEIYQEKEVSGYGLNLSWRNMASDPSGPRLITERAVAYFPKDKVRGFLRREIDQNKFLSEAVIFAVEENGPMNLVSYRPQEVKPDSRPQIREENLAVAKADPQPEPTGSPSKSAVPVEEASKSKTSADKAHDEREESKPKPAPTVAPPLPAEKKPEMHASAPLTGMTNAAITTPAPNIVPPKQDKPPEQKVSEPVKGDRSSDTKTEAEKPSEKKPEVLPPVPAAAKTQDKGDKGVHQTPELSSDTSAGPGVGKAALSKLPTKSDMQKVETSKAADIAPEQVTSAKAAQPIAQKPVEKAREPGAQPQKAVETKTNVAAAQLTGTTKTPDWVPPASRADQFKAPEVMVEPVAKPSRAMETKANTPAGPIVSAPVVSQAAEAKKPEKTMEHSVTPQKIETAASQSAQKPHIEPTKADTTSSATKSLSAPPAAIPTAPRISEVPKSEKIGEAKPQDMFASKTEAAKTAIQPVEAKKVEPVVVAPKREVKTSDVTSVEQVVAKEKAPRTLEQPRLVEEKKSDAAPTQAKLEAKIPPAMKTAPMAPVPSPPEKASEKSTREQLALLKKPIESVPEKKPLAPPAPKALEGFIIQVAFSDRSAAQHWAETFGRRGYAVSVTEAGSAGSLRVRIGNFAMREEAERQLRRLREQGLTGIIINLPQAYRPEVRPTEGTESGRTLSGAP